ncbi:hypothetical protein [Pseudomonas sp. PB106]|uniref:hypothetical protein n=1 Tax=Pseudomonas sp. PB106 TaxID=2494699 RepID=UPI00131DA557|nr:hypothetical protein [Pseudomonas sp. PB106]KAE9648927.1 hypothetical protein EJA71_04140 [Pseudomonas sp. PB106]
MNTKFEIFVCAGAVILVADELSDADRSDSLDALLYSQTVAAHKAADMRDADTWIHANKVAMRATGAMLSDNPSGNLPITVLENFTLLELTTRLLHLWVPATAPCVRASTVELQLNQALATAANEQLQQHVLLGGKWIRFILGFVSAGTVITTITLSFEVADSVIDNVMQHRFSRESIPGNVFVEGYRALVDPEDYDFSRAKIISLLGERRQEQIIALS